jgi:hypothetical protein
VNRPGIIPYRHEAGGFALPLPEDWVRLDGPVPGISLVALEPDRPEERFRANLVVTVEELDDGLDLDGWQASTEEHLPSALNDYLLLDRERMDLNGRVAIRRLAHHARPETGSITMEQWAFVVGRRGITLTASSSTLDHDTLADVFAGIAGEFEA